MKALMDNDRLDKKAALQDILLASRSLAVYRGLGELPPLKLLRELLEGLLEDLWKPSKLVEAYYSFVNAFLSGENLALSSNYSSWKMWILDTVLHTENDFTLKGENHPEDISKSMITAVAHDLDCIVRLANIPWATLISILEDRMGQGKILNIFDQDDERNWLDLCRSKGLEGWDVDYLISYYRNKGCGLFSIYKGFYWNGKFLEGIEHIDPITLNQLIGYDTQKDILMDNTEKFLSGYAANNVLLYGDKGTGKSSMIKALVHEYGDRGLRIIELPRIYLDDYNKILKAVENRRFKFILFVDDLSFEEHEVEYKHIKALLEGGLKVRPSNLLVYATSNRRHLVRQLASDRSSTGYHYNDRDEISPTDSMQEKLSLADRFGITLTFISPNQKGYLEMIESMARERGIDMERKILYEKALRWEKKYNGRSGRTAKQFIDDLAAADSAGNHS